MPEIRLENANLEFGDMPLLDKANCVINKGDRIGVIGRNGAGKSSLLKVIQGVLPLDDGELKKQAQLKIATMQQTVPLDLTGTVMGFLKSAHHSEHDWENHAIEKTLSQLQLDPNAKLENLSGGQIRRALLGQALINEPDVLLLDEPTNHLDIKTIEWLEQFLKNRHKTLLFVTHDRTFLQNIATRIFELDLGKLTCWDNDYASFLKYKATELMAEKTQQVLFDKRLAQEEVWIRQGIKARRTRNEGRVRALKKMRAERAARQTRQGKMNLQQQETAYSGKVAFIAEHLEITFDNKPLVNDFSVIIMPGDKVGIIGPNGCGKTSLINVLLGNLQPNAGTVKHGTKINIAYFDQHRMQLDHHLSAIDNVAEGRTEIEINGKRKHIISYLQDFLFSPQKARSPISTFSGGERNRLLLAKLFSKPCNVLILDEPSNDLDMETLDLLEEYLTEFKGVLLIVSHDRTLLNNVITSGIVFHEHGRLETFVGSYDDYYNQQKTNVQPKSQKKLPEKLKKNQPKKLGFNEQRELNSLPQEIEKLEQEISTLQTTMTDPQFYQQDGHIISSVQTALKELEASLEARYQRWQFLDDLHNSTN